MSLIFPIQGANLLPLSTTEGVAVRSVAFSALELGLLAHSPALGVLEIGGATRARAMAAVAIATLSNVSAFSAIELGNQLSSVANSALEVQTGEGVVFIVDVLDEILVSASGDCQT